MANLLQAIWYDITGAGKHNMWTGEKLPEEEWKEFDWAVCEYKGQKVQGTLAGRTMVSLDQAKSVSEVSRIRDNAYEKARQIGDPNLRVSTLDAIRKVSDQKNKELQR